MLRCNYFTEEAAIFEMLSDCMYVVVHGVGSRCDETDSARHHRSCSIERIRASAFADLGLMSLLK